MDHVIPRDHGGATSWENVVISCIRCNSKSNRSSKGSRYAFVKEPKRPPRRPFMTSLYGKPMEDTWSHFVGKVVHFFLMFLANAEKQAMMD